MAVATLNGTPVFDGKLVVPYSGLWHAQLRLDLAVGTTGPQTLTWSGVSWTCAVVRAIDFTGHRGILLVAGAGGWRTTIPYRQYGQGGVPTQIVIQDAALACGELQPVIDPSVTATTGQAWDRAAGPASNVLRDLLGGAWWADASGRVQTAPRAATPITSAFQALEVDGAAGLYEISSDTPFDWAPGRTFSGPTVSGTISRVEHTLKGASTRLTVMVTP